MNNFAPSSLLPYLAVGVFWPCLMRFAQKTRAAKTFFTQLFMYSWLIYLQFLQHYLATIGADFPILQTSVHINSYGIFPLGLMSIFYAFITFSPKIFGRMCASIICANLLMAIIIAFRKAGWMTMILHDWEPFYEDGSAKILAIGTALLIADIIIMVSTYINISKYNIGFFMNIFISLNIALLFDAVGFSFVIAHCRESEYLPILCDQIQAKLIAGTVYTLWFSFNSRYIGERSIIDIRVDALKKFFAEALPILRKVLRRFGFAFCFTLLISILTWLVEFDIRHAIMREHGKDAARSGPEKQEPDRAKPVPPGQQTFADAVGGSARHGISQTIIKQKYEAKDLALPKADVDIDPALLLPYTGEWIAWSPDGRNVVAHAKDPVMLEQLLNESGLEMSQCVLDYIDEGTEI